MFPRVASADTGGGEGGGTASTSTVDIVRPVTMSPWLGSRLLCRFRVPPRWFLSLNRGPPPPLSTAAPSTPPLQPSFSPCVYDSHSVQRNSQKWSGAPPDETTSSRLMRTRQRRALAFYNILPNSEISQRARSGPRFAMETMTCSLLLTALTLAIAEDCLQCSKQPSMALDQIGSD